MRLAARRSAIALAIAGLAAMSTASAVTLVRMNLSDMCKDADRIYQGTVIQAEAGTVEAGGGTLPVMNYRIAVDESFKGTFTEIKGQRFADLTMLGKLAAPEIEGVKRFDPLPELPALEVGRTYLLFQTRPGPAGLSSTIGLGQGWFRVSGKGDKTQVVNGFDNTGLFAGMEVAGAPARGPISYSFMVEQIRAQLGAE